MSQNISLLLSQYTHDEIKFFMSKALEQAELAYKENEVPVGCVFVCPKTKKIISEGHNQTNKQLQGVEHAELVAINKVLLGKKLENNSNINEEIVLCSDSKISQSSYNIFKGSTLFVTCEPCIMCAGAIGQLEVSGVFYGCSNDRFGGNGSILSLHNNEKMNKKLSEFIENEEKSQINNENIVENNNVNILKKSIKFKEVNNFNHISYDYEVIRGIDEEAAIKIFQNFYDTENRRAPEDKRKKKNKKDDDIKESE